MKTRANVIVGLVFVVAGCTDTNATSRLTAPNAVPSLAVIPGVLGRVTNAADAAEVMIRSSDAEDSRAAAGARATGYAESVSIFSGAVSKDSFTVLATSPTVIGGPFFPFFPAKGEVQGTIEQTVGGVTVTQTIHADIDCASFVNVAPVQLFGRMAIASGPIKRWVRDGEPVPFPPGQEVLFTVQDNGEGADSPPDRASSLIPISGGQLACRDLFLFMFQNQQGNIQVVFPGERGSDR
jgi:hypothetical protein